MLPNKWWIICLALYSHHLVAVTVSMMMTNPLPEDLNHETHVAVCQLLSWTTALVLYCSHCFVTGVFILPALLIWASRKRKLMQVMICENNQCSKLVLHITYWCNGSCAVFGDLVASTTLLWRHSVHDWWGDKFQAYTAVDELLGWHATKKRTAIFIVTVTQTMKHLKMDGWNMEQWLVHMTLIIHPHESSGVGATANFVGFNKQCGMFHRKLKHKLVGITAVKLSKAF